MPSALAKHGFAFGKTLVKHKFGSRVKQPRFWPQVDTKEMMQAKIQSDFPRKKSYGILMNPMVSGRSKQEEKIQENFDSRNLNWR